MTRCCNNSFINSKIPFSIEGFLRVDFLVGAVFFEMQSYPKRRFTYSSYGPSPFAGAVASARGRAVVRYARPQYLRRRNRMAANVGVRRMARAMLNRRTAGFLGVETKFYDTMLANASVAAATDASGGEYDPSATSMISTPTQGDGEQQRDGKRINILNVQVKGSVTRTFQEDIVNPPSADRVFVALVLDTQSNAAQMNSEDCFKNLSNTVTGNASPLRNLLQSSRFRVLKSEVLDLTYPTLGVEGDNLHSVGAVQQCFDWFIPFPAGLPVNFNSGTTASIANVVDNSLHVIAYSQTAQPTLTYNARIRFQG